MPTSDSNEILITTEDRLLFQVAHQIADMVFLIKEEDKYLEDGRNEPANPLYDQTASGLMLELYYGVPNMFWTPWGKWNFGGGASGKWQVEMSFLMEHLSLLEARPIYNNAEGTFGPIYGIYSIHKFILPNPVFREKDSYMEYQLARETWAMLTEEYQGTITK